MLYIWRLETSGSCNPIPESSTITTDRMKLYCKQGGGSEIKFAGGPKKSVKPLLTIEKF